MSSAASAFVSDLVSYEQRPRPTALRAISSGTTTIETLAPTTDDASSLSVAGQLQIERVFFYPTRLVLASEHYRDELDREFSEAFGAIGDALFVTRNEDATGLDLYVVVPEHSDAVYAALIDAEDRFFSKHASAKVEVKVRAHQGKPIELAVPSDARRVNVE